MVQLLVPAWAGASTGPALTAAPQQPPLKLKAATYNINNARGTDNVPDTTRIADAIRSTGAEVIALQAVDKNYSSRSSYEDQPKLISEKLGMYYVFAPNVDLAPEPGRTERRQFGTMILSKYPIVSSMNHPLSNSGTEKRALLEADIEVNGTTIRYFTTHMDTSSTMRLKQADEILAIVRSQSVPAIVAAYPNALDTSAEMKQLFTELNDAFFDQPEAFTNPSQLPAKRISYIMPDRNWELGEAKVVPSLASTHLPIVSELTLNPDAHLNPNIKSLAFTDKIKIETVGTTSTFKLQAYMTNGTIRDVTNHSQYANTQPHVADIPAPGVLRALASGTTVITATYGQSTANLPVSVYLKNPNLSSISVNGVPIPGFTPSQTDYYFTLPADNRQVPAVTAVTEDPNGATKIQLPSVVPGIVYVIGTADDGLTTKEYRIHFAEEKTDVHFPIKVMSYNIHHGADPSDNYNLERIADVIRQSGAEIVGLQEVDRYYSSRSNNEDTIQRLSDLLGMQFAYGANLDRPPSEPGQPRSQYGTAVLSKYPIMQNQNYWLTSYGQEQRGVLETTIDVQGVQLSFYSTHLGLDAIQRNTQADEILAIMAKRSGPKILVGDFNARPYAPEMSKFTKELQNQFADQPNGFTIDSVNPSATIDYILASSDVMLGERENARVIQTQASDHLPIVSNLYLKRQLQQLTVDRTDGKAVIGEQYPLKVTGSYSGGFTSDVTSHVKYTVSDSSVLTVSPSGIVTPLNPGAAEIEATLDGIIASSTVYVMSNNSRLASIQLEGAPLAGFAAELLEYTVYLPEGTSSALPITADAADAKANIAVSQAEGVPGAATIVVTAEDGVHHTTYRVYFERNSIVGMVLSPADWKAEPGEETTVTAYLQYKDGSRKEVPEKVKFAHSDGSVASVNAHGEVKAHLAGTSSVTATFGEYTAAMNVVVNGSRK
ncbi:endonuclease/exonuclease/phosphatase family protein [Paenibacillus silviterrae]|uniref:endonuclease/exonuclease/phosphatase family protein n=1 Tax=Paenibacillus silviterrae TaxID=3242194 RepID=UPI002543CA7E|nr:endonuclease/exonuclease/phosphatase family protein [Paenibacillus chinjuensis]